MNPLPPTESLPAAPKAATAESSVLLAMVSDLTGVAPGQIGPDFALAAGRLRNSLGRANLDAKIRRRFGVRLENLHRLRTFGELEAAVIGNQPAGSIPAASEAHPPPGTKAAPAPILADVPFGAQTSSTTPVESGLACGVDIETIASLPDVKDYWEEAFYRNHFSAAEIAYCVSQANPRMHFAARWCAKEAFKKCRPEYMARDLNLVEVVQAASGRPWIQLIEAGGHAKPPVALSLSHDEHSAIAVVVSLPEPPRTHNIPSVSSGISGRGFSFVLNLITFLASLLALGFALLRFH